MSTVFAFKLADATQQGIDELLTNLDNKVAAPQYALHSRVSIELVDEILKNAVEDLIALFQDGSDEGAGILTTLLNVVKGTAHVMIKQLLGKHDNKEVAQMAQYLRSRHAAVSGEVRFGFELPAEMAASFKKLFVEIEAGNGKAHREELQATMQAFADLALVRFFDDFIAPMNLGMLKRGAANLGRGTIHKGLQVAISKLIPKLGEKELAVFSKHYQTLIVDA